MDKKITINGACNNLGYGQVTKNICKELIKLGVDLSLFPIGHHIDVEENEQEFFQTLIQNSKNKAKIDHTCVKIWHQFDLWSHISRPHYGWSIFELDTLTDLEISSLRFPDRLIVCSNWAKEILKKYGLNSDVVPLGVNRDIFHENFPTNSQESYRFFSVGKLEHRKGHEFTIRCYNKAFSRQDKVELHLMVHNPFLQPEIIQQWYNNFLNSKLGHTIKLYNPVASHADVAKFIHQNDCGLFPARAEGWNLELLESMSCGKPVITTNYSAHTEYCNNKNSFLIDIDAVEPAYDNMGGMWFHGQGNWAELDFEQEEQMIEHMRYCYNNRPANNAGIDTAKEFSWSKSAEKLLELV